VIIGIFYSTIQNGDSDKFSSNPMEIFIKMLQIYITFQMLYTIIYIINEITDIKLDSNNAKKQNRAFASKIFSVNDGLIIVFILFVFVYILLKTFFNSKVMIFTVLCSLFLTINLFYSLIIKKNKYLLGLRPFIGVTAALRFNLGIILMVSPKEFYMNNYTEVSYLSLLFFFGMSSLQCVQFLMESGFCVSKISQLYQVIFIISQILFWTICVQLNTITIFPIVTANIWFNYAIFIFPNCTVHFKFHTIDNDAITDINYNYLTWLILTKNGNYKQLLFFFYYSIMDAIKYAVG